MRLVGAELLKMVRRPMTYVLPALLIAVMAFAFLVIGGLILGLNEQVGGPLGPLGLDVSRFVYAIVGNFVFGLGSLLSVIYAGAIVGGDYSWGVLRNPIARGESRVFYVLAKAIGLAIMISLGAVICFLIGVLIIALVASSARFDLSALLTADGLLAFATALGVGTLVLLQRAAIGIAIALLMRSQLAGIVVAVVLYFAEPFVASIATAISRAGTVLQPDAEVALHWTQFLPFSVGSTALGGASAALDLTLVGVDVPLWLPVSVVALYLVGALVLAGLIIRRQDII